MFRKDQFAEIASKEKFFKWVIAGHRMVNLENKSLHCIHYDYNQLLIYKGEVYDIEEETTDDYFGMHDFYWIEAFKHFILTDLYQRDANISLIFVDLNDNEMLCYTDELGQNSLYMNKEGEVSRSINQLKSWDSVLDYSYLWEIRNNGYNINCKTPYKDVKRLEPWVIYTGKIGKIYYEHNKYYPSYGHNKRPNTLPLDLHNAVKLRLNKCSKDENIWVLISWWLDSSIIAAILLQEKEPEQKLTFFTTENAEDWKYVKELCEFLNISVIELEKQNVEIKWIIDINETPIDLGSVIPNIQLFKALNAHWITHVFTWDWADELFRWYRRNAEPDFDYHENDILNELTYYHFPRLEKSATYYWIELLTPFVSKPIIDYSLTHEILKFKEDLKNMSNGLIPESIIERTKNPLKNKEIREDRIAYRNKFLNQFISYIKEQWEYIQRKKKSSQK